MFALRIKFATTFESSMFNSCADKNSLKVYLNHQAKALKASAIRSKY